MYLSYKYLLALLWNYSALEGQFLFDNLNYMSHVLFTPKLSLLKRIERIVSFFLHYIRKFNEKALETHCFVAIRQFYISFQAREIEQQQMYQKTRNNVRRGYNWEMNGEAENLTDIRFYRDRANKMLNNIK